MSEQIAVVIPVRSLEGAKSRLGDVLDAEERRDLVIRLLRATVRASCGAGIEQVWVVSDDGEAAQIALEEGARFVRPGRAGLNPALDAGRDAAVGAGAQALLVLPGDLPLVDAETVRALVAALEPAPGADAGRDSSADAPPRVVLVPDRHRRGTNALALRPPDVVPFAFGRDSRARHEELARAAGAEYVELESPLEIDLDTAEDLLLVEDRLVATDVR